MQQDRKSELRSLRLACHTATELWDDERRERLAERHLALARTAGTPAYLPYALDLRVGAHLDAGELGEAAALLADRGGVTPRADLALAAYRGREADASATTGPAGAAGHAARALLYNSLERHEEALAEAELADPLLGDLGVSGWARFELVEAAARGGHPARAAGALHRLARTTQAARTEWGLGVEAHASALLSGGDDAERLYREAIERLGRTRIRFGLARAHLAYGEWLRRRRRRHADACEQLRAARALFAEMGAEAFEQRAARELPADARRLRAPSPCLLSPQQAKIARLARAGLSNAEIGGRLRISPKTVEYHLGKAFGKLGISSRSQLGLVIHSDVLSD
jgi:DNA-binding CsgD family transcriptional regulator